MMKIIYISAETIPGDSGGSVHTFEVARQLVKIGYQVTVLCHKAYGQSNKEEIDGVEIIRKNLDVFNKRIPLLNFFRIRRLNLKDYDLLLERYSWISGAGIYLANKKNIPSFLEVNSPVLEEVIWKFNWKKKQLRARVLNKISEFQMRETTGIITTIPEIIDEQYRDKALFIEWGVNTELFNFNLKDKEEVIKLKKEFFDLDDFVVVFSGSYYPWHGVKDLPEIISACQINPAIKFLLIGSGLLWDEVKTELETRKLIDRVVFIKQAPYHKMPAYIAIADLGLAPFNIDYYPPLEKYGFFWSPLKIFEYMATGLPVLTSSYPRLEEILKDGPCSIYARAGDTKDFANSILEAARDKSRLKKMGNAGRKLAEDKYSWKIHTRKLSEFFKNRLNGPSIG